MKPSAGFFISSNVWCVGSIVMTRIEPWLSAAMLVLGIAYLVVAIIALKREA